MHAQVAYGLNEEQMRRWGLYVSRPLGPEESINLFSGAADNVSTKGQFTGHLAGAGR